jgi:hypothetical protein
MSYLLLAILFCILTFLICWSVDDQEILIGDSSAESSARTKAPRIPRILHRIHPSGYLRDHSPKDSLPSLYSASIVQNLFEQSLLANHPMNGMVINNTDHIITVTEHDGNIWTYIDWTDQMADAFMQVNFPVEYRELYEKLYWIQQADLLRVCIMYKLGGFYVDTDVLFHGQMYDWFDRYEGVIQAWVPHSLRNFPWSSEEVSNWMLASTPRYSFWRLLIDNMLAKSHFLCDTQDLNFEWTWRCSSVVTWTTGAKMITKSFNEFKEKNPHLTNTIGVFGYPEFGSFYCPASLIDHLSATAPVPTERIATHAGGSSRAHKNLKTHNWNRFASIQHLECLARQFLGISGEICQIPFLLSLTIPFFVVSALYVLVGLRSCSFKNLSCKVNSLNYLMRSKYIVNSGFPSTIDTIKMQ